MNLAIVNPFPGRLSGGGCRTEVFEPPRIHRGVVLHTTKHPQSHHSTQDRVTGTPPWLPPPPPPPHFTEETFQRHHFGLDTPQSGRR